MDDMVRWVKAYLAGVSVDDAAEAVEEIDAVGPAGTHLSRKFTRRRYRDWLVGDLLDQQPYDAWEAAGATTLLERTAQKTRELLREPAFRLGDDVNAELERLLDTVRSRG
jgi:trimethylamine:corrinoid methyltransferase-like protein